MAKLTSSITLTSAWQAIGTGLGTLLVQVDPASPGYVGIAVADLLADLTAESDPQHRLTAAAQSTMNLTGVTGKIVCARKLVATETVKLIVTEY